MKSVGPNSAPPEFATPLLTVVDGRPAFVLRRPKVERVSTGHGLHALLVHHADGPRTARKRLYLPGRAPEEMAERRRTRRDYIINGQRCTQAQWDSYWAWRLAASRRGGGGAA